jgi:UDP-glucose 4-epimerase
MANYLITGGCGFIGSHLCYRLIELGHSVLVLDDLSTGKLANLPQAAQFIEGDIRDKALLINLLANVDGCFHLAAIASVQLCHDDWMKAHEINLTGTINIFEAAKCATRHGNIPKIVYASSAATYGNIDIFPLNESMSSPISVYGVNKLCNEYYARIATSAYGIKTTGLRLFNIYGPRQNPNSAYSGVITIFLNRLFANEPLIIYGDGKQSRDFVYVEDAVNFFLSAMHTHLEQANVFNVCSGTSVTIKEIGDVLANALGIVPRYIYQPGKPGDIYQSFGDPTFATKMLHTTATTSLLDGLTRLITYHKQVVT